jgi:hypothetical protein
MRLLVPNDLPCMKSGGNEVVRLRELQLTAEVSVKFILPLSLLCDVISLCHHSMGSKALVNSPAEASFHVMSGHMMMALKNQAYV